MYKKLEYKIYTIKYLHNQKEVFFDYGIIKIKYGDKKIDI